MSRNSLDIYRDSAVQSLAAVRGPAVCTERPRRRAGETGRVRHGLLWIAQLILAGVFLLVRVSKIVAYEKFVKELEARSKSGPIGMSRVQAAVVARRTAIRRFPG